MGTSAFNSRSVYGAVAMDSSYGWYTFGPGAAVSSCSTTLRQCGLKPLSPPRISQARSISYSTNAGGSATPVYAADVRKTLVLSSSAGYTVYAVSSSTTAPGVGVIALLPFGVLPTSSLASATLLSTNTTTDAFYGPTASPASFTFQNTSWLWICDDGGVATRGLWLFQFNSGVGRFQPQSALSRVWSAGTCSDVVLQAEGSQAVLYWVGGSTGEGNSIYRMPVASPYSATLLVSAASKCGLQAIFE